MSFVCDLRRSVGSLLSLESPMSNPSSSGKEETRPLLPSLFTSHDRLNSIDQKTVTWQGISASVPLQKGRNATRKTVLNEVHGVARPGEILAIMGGSGAGKTTLMNILACQKSAVVEATGDVRINGDVVRERDMQMHSAYVQQVDVFCGAITVREQLTFSARLRMARDSSDEERRTRVETVIREMNLTDCQNTAIGIPGRVKGISIGEKKRLAFASEVLTDPSILFCDEPTSGLDSFMASQVVSALRAMASSGKTVITVIHQPSSQVFNMFDTVCFMSGGKTAYHGPVKEVVPFFDSLGRPDLMVPESYNPADHVIAKISVDKETAERDMARLKLIRDTFEHSSMGQKLLEESAQTPSNEATTAIEKQKRQRYPSTFFTQLLVLMRRAFLTTLRDPVLLRVRVAQIVIVSLSIGVVSWRTDLKGSTLINREGVLYNVCRDMNFFFLFQSVNSICSELPLFFREHKARIYSVEAYYFAKTLAELPQYTILPLFYAVIVYWMTGLLEEAANFSIFCVISVLQVWVANSIAYAGACAFAEEGVAVTYMPIYILPMLIFGGFYINFDLIPPYFKWMAYLSWFRYGFEALEINQWESIENIPGCPNNLEDAKKVIAAGSKTYCPAMNGKHLLSLRGVDSDDFSRDILILVGFMVIYRFIGLAALYLRVRFQKNAA